MAMTGQVITGWHEYNNTRREYHQADISLSKYFSTGHFYQATFENWESEFLQMGVYVLLTVWLRQRGSSESKKVDEKEEVDREPDSSKTDAPWPVRKGGLALALYRNSLSVAFLILFAMSYLLHAWGSLDFYNEEQNLQGKKILSMSQYMHESRFWFESFQNWQSEFVAVISIVVLSIFLRQKGSPESKPVDASYHDTGSS